MARKPTKKQLHDFHMALSELVQATLEGGFVYTDKATHEYLIAQGHAEINSDMVDENGDIATRATDAGIAHINGDSDTAGDASNDAEEKEAETAVDTGQEQNEDVQSKASEDVSTSNSKPQKSESNNMSIQIEKNVTVPSVTGRGRKSSMYPFDDMEVGDSFMVVATEDKPDPAKSLASTVAGANARYAEETGEMRVNRNGKEVPATRQTRKFIVRSVEGGARVWRVDVE